MAKRESLESKVVQYFTHEPLQVANTVFGICKGIMKSRNEEALPTGTAGSKVRKARTKKSAPKSTGSGSQTSFPGPGVENDAA